MAQIFSSIYRHKWDVPLVAKLQYFKLNFMLYRY
jgi:hypothetical protein